MLASGLGELAQTALIDALLSLPLITVYLLYAIGIVVIYRSSRVLNLAHGAMAMAPAYFFYSLERLGVPALLAVVLAVLGGAVLGMSVERFVVRRLRKQGPTAQTVGTVAVFGLVVALVAKFYGTASLVPERLFPSGSIPIGLTGIRYGQIIVFVIGVVIAGGLFALFRYTGVGLAMRASADNRRGAMLNGIDVERTTSFAWALGGGLAGLAGVLVGTLTNIQPYTLSLQVLPAFVAVLIGGLGSLPGAVVGAIIVGLVQGEVPALILVPGLSEVAGGVGFPQLVLMIVTFIVMAVRGRRLVGSQVRDAALSAEDVPTVRTTRPPWASKAGVLVGVGLAVFPFLPGLPFSLLGDATLASLYLLVALSLVLLTGWVGQISLAQAEFVGIGAFSTALMTNSWHIPFPLTLPLAMLAAGVSAVGLGLVALRVRGLYLAVATLVFAAMADTFLFNQSWFGIVGGSTSIQLDPLGDPNGLPRFDFNDAKLVYLVCAAFAATTVYAMANMRESKTGRAFFAVRGSEIAAASLGIGVTRYKLLAFGLSGVLTGAAGNLYMVYLGSATPESFNVLASLFFLSVAVVGGLLSLGGAIGAAILFAGLQELFFRVHALAGFLNIVSSALLLGVLLMYPGGLARIPVGLVAASQRIRLKVAGPLQRRGSVLLVPGARLVRQGRASLQRLWDALPVRGLRTWVHERKRRLPLDALDQLLPKDAASAELSEPLADAAPNQDQMARVLSLVDPRKTPGDSPLGEAGPDVRKREPSGERPEERLLDVVDATVRFGGLTAVNGVSLSLRGGEIVGLIGANGAGKTTLFNVVTGLVQPVEGEVSLLGQPATTLDVHERAALGVARTFQDIQLFPQLTVFDNLLVATHLRNGSSLFGNIVVSRRAFTAEREARERVRTVLDFLAITEFATRRIGDLSFGQLRLVEVARTLVTGARVILLDEPASGLDTVETERLADLLLYIRRHLGVSMLIIEHDVRTVVELSDYMYVLDHGSLIAQGTPQEVQSSDAVIAAYLGQAPAAEAQA